MSLHMRAFGIYVGKALLHWKVNAERHRDDWYCLLIRATPCCLAAYLDSLVHPYAARSRRLNMLFAPECCTASRLKLTSPVAVETHEQPGNTRQAADLVAVPCGIFLLHALSFLSIRSLNRLRGITARQPPFSDTFRGIHPAAHGHSGPRAAWRRPPNRRWSKQPQGWCFS